MNADAAYVGIVTPKLVLVDRLGLEHGVAAAEKLLAKRVAQQGVLGRRYAWSFMQPSGAALREVGKLFESGAIRSAIDSVYPLEELAAAHERSESGQVSGKILVDVIV